MNCERFYPRNVVLDVFIKLKVTHSTCLWYFFCVFRVASGLTYMGVPEESTPCLLHIGHLVFIYDSNLYRRKLMPVYVAA
jgi:hypothetical protein